VLDKTLAMGTRRFIKRLLYAQVALRDAAMVMLGRQDPTLRFTVLADPCSVYINFELKKNALDDFIDHIGLPEEFALTPVRCLDGEDPAYLLTLNIYQVSGIVRGSRAEWSTYVDDGEGKPRYMVLEARSSSGSMDPVNIVTRADRVDHARKAENLVSTVASKGGQVFRSRISLSDKHPLAKLATEWIAANDRIYWRNGVFDRAWYDGNLFDSPVRVISRKDIEVDDGTEWARFVKRSPRHVLRYESELQFVLSPWFNVR